MSLPSLPLFPDAYFGATKHLTCEQHGAYLQLLMIAWQSAECAVVNDDRLIARMISLPLKRWLAIKAAVMAFWDLGDDGLWRQKRLSEEYQYVSARVEKRREAGRLGGRPKSLENNEPTKANGSPGETERVTIQKAPTPTPTPTPKEIYMNDRVNSSAARPPAFPSDGTIDYSPFADVARRSGRGVDVNVLASAFRKWCHSRDIPFDSPHIALTFSKFCGQHRLVGGARAA
jgi:uncharacterized protein YdaU (DUF1376 family)